MLKYTVKRLAQSLVTILLIATIVFLLMRCLPTDYYFTEEQLMKFTEEQKYAALEAAGLTDPIGTQLIHFYNDINEWELYNLNTDPEELHNLYGKKGYEAVTKRLMKELVKLQKQYDDQDALKFNNM